MTDIFSLSLEELAAQIKDAQLTSVDVCKKYIERINKFEKEVKAWAHFDIKVLLEKAAEAEREKQLTGRPGVSLMQSQQAARESRLHWTSSSNSKT